MEPQLPQLAVQLPRIRLTQQRPLLSQQVDVERRRRELRRRQLLQPVADLGLEFDGTQRHSNNAIGSVTPTLDHDIVQDPGDVRDPSQARHVQTVSRGQSALASRQIGTSVSEAISCHGRAVNDRAAPHCTRQRR